MKTSSRRPLFLLIVAMAFGGGALGGFWIARLQIEESTPDPGYAATKRESMPSPVPVVAVERTPEADVSARRELDQIDRIFRGPQSDAFMEAANWAVHQSLEMIEAAVERVLTEPNSARREFILRGLATRWGELDFDQVRDFAEAQTSDERVALLNLALTGFARNDPAEAWAVYCEVSRHGADSNFHSRELFESLATQDPVFALECLRSLDGAAKNTSRAFCGILDAAERDQSVPRLWDSLRSLPASMQSPLQSIYWRHRGYYDGPAALADMSSSSFSDNERQQAMASFFSGWGRFDGAVALDYIYTNLSEVEQQTFAPMAILDWIDHGDPDLILTHLNQIPSDTLSDRAILGISSELAGVDGRTAAAWAESIPNRDLREEALENVIWYWGKNAPEQAQSYLMAMEDTEMRSSLAWDALISMARNGLIDEQSLSLINLRTTNSRKRTLLKQIASNLADPRYLRQNPNSLEAVRTLANEAPFLDEAQRAKILAILGGG